MNKKELRQLYKQKRTELSEKEQMKLDDLLLIQFQQLAFNNLFTLLTYWPLDEKREINTNIMTDYLSFRFPELQVCYPVIDNATGSFKAIAVNDDTRFKLNDYGIGEPEEGDEIPPEELDLVFTPLLCFDQRGYRVGYGKGFYDKFLALCHPDVIKAGFSYFEAEEQIDDINEFDVPLSFCITPNRIYEF